MKWPIQARLVEIIRRQTPGHISLPQTLSQLLDISPDSAYRRLRGETAFTLDEAALICRHFDVPLEALNDLLGLVVSFRYQVPGADAHSFADFLERFLQQIRAVQAFETRRVWYAAEDIPLFYVLGQPLLAAFKIFYWRKGILNHEDLQNQKFSRAFDPGPAAKTGADASLAYADIESTEIWTEETISGTLGQIRFFWEAGFFESDDDVLALVEELESLFQHIQRQCDLGLKITPGGTVTAVPFAFYVSDLMIGNNAVRVETNKGSATFLGYNTFSFMSTTNPDFNHNNRVWMDNLMAKSTQISRTAEKLRNQFFKHLFRKTADLKNLIRQS